jgi:hypothetical protein
MFDERKSELPLPAWPGDAERIQRGIPLLG